MRIKTVWALYPDTFDDQVNAALGEGWRLVRREVLQDPNRTEDSALYAELVLPDPEPDPEPVPITENPLAALRTVRDFCAGKKLDECMTLKCPLAAWCDQYTPNGESPSDWKIPGEEAEA